MMKQNVNTKCSHKVMTQINDNVDQTKWWYKVVNQSDDKNLRHKKVSHDNETKWWDNKGTTRWNTLMKQSSDTKWW